MSRAYFDIAFTPAVREVQARMGSRERYASLDAAAGGADALTEREAAFIEARDGFYQATISETGWPYVQFRGGPAGFLKVLDAKTLGYADFRGNVQYISAGNLRVNERIALILMDYANQRRLKLMGRARLLDVRDDPGLIERLRVPGYRARIERAVLIAVEAYDWNCPQHITPRFTEAEFALAAAPLREPPRELGRGSLPLVVAGMRQLTPRVRAYELRPAGGGALPQVQAGAHLELPFRLADGRHGTRRYSVASSPLRRDACEIAVLREDEGSGGSRAIHGDYALGLVLNAGVPGNDFPLHGDARPSVLIAGGIGITPIKAMAHQLKAEGRRFALHYAVRSRVEAAFASELAEQFGDALTLYAADEGRRLSVDEVMAHVEPDAVFYVCGPARLIDEVRAKARAAGIADERVRFERFAAAPAATPDKPLAVTLQRSGRTLAVAAGQTILQAVEAAGIDAPYSCRAGTCGTCAVKVLAGAPEHRDHALSEAEHRQAGLMCICVSRATTPELTLDL